MTDAKQAFSELKEDAGFRRVDAVHVLNLYYGYDPQGARHTASCKQRTSAGNPLIPYYFGRDKETQRWQVGAFFCIAAAGIQRSVLQLLQRHG